MAKFFALLVADDRLEILDLDEPLANEYDLSDVSDPRDPGIANELRVKRLESAPGDPLRQQMRELHNSAAIPDL
jgi:hypothetical protein